MAAPENCPSFPEWMAWGCLEDGKRVYFGIARSPYGTFAERALASSWISIELPDALDDVTAAGIANPGMSSWVALTSRAKFVAGESVLVLGATGVAGQLAVQIVKRLGGRRVIAAGRNPKALEELKELGADSVISLDQHARRAGHLIPSGVGAKPSRRHPRLPLGSSRRSAARRALTERPAHRIFTHSVYPDRIDSGPSISLSAATLRSSAIELLGSGFGSASLDQIVQAVMEFFKVAASQPFQFKPKAVPLKDVEALWNSPESGVRLVFQP